MAELTTIARPYAKAAFMFAKEQNALAEWEQMLGLAAAVAVGAERRLWRRSFACAASRRLRWSA